MKSRAILLPILTLLVVADALAGDKRIADGGVTRLAPAVFRQLPKAIIKDLEKRGCRIPQTYIEKEKHNVISGEFARRGRKNWAILCSLKGSSSILVYWDATGKNVSRVASESDDVYLQDAGSGRYEFSRMIDIADARYIYSHYRSYGGRKPPRITHHGINDIYAEKASTVFYFHRRKWLELQGAD